MHALNLTWLKKHDFYDLSKVILAISDTAIEISKLIYSPKSKDLGKITGRQNTDGDLTKSLDLKADEIIKLKKNLEEKNMSIVPKKLFINNKGLAKIEISLAKGKKLVDKRESIKKKDRLLN